MFRKHFRFKRAALGLAFATMLIPVAPAGAVSLSTFVDGGPAPVSNTAVTSYQPSYLRYHEVGGPVAAGPQITSERSATTATITPLQADGLRWTAMAKMYEQRQQTATITPLQADGLRWTAMAKMYEQRQQPSVAISERSNGVQGPDPSLVPQLALSTSSGFDWTDAGVGASTVLAAALLLGIGLLLTRRHQDTGLAA